MLWSLKYVFHDDCISLYDYIVRIEHLKVWHNVIINIFIIEWYDSNFSVSSILFKYYTLLAFKPDTFLHCTWSRYVRRCMKDPSHEFLTNKWLLHNSLMDLGNPFEIVVHYLLIEGIKSLSHQDKILMVSVLMYMIAYWTRPMVTHNINCW